MRLEDVRLSDFFTSSDDSIRSWMVNNEILDLVPSCLNPKHPGEDSILGRRAGACFGQLELARQLQLEFVPGEGLAGVFGRTALCGAGSFPS